MLRQRRQHRFRHWYGVFHDDGQGFHDWSSGHEDNVLTPWGSDPVSVELCSRPGPGYELEVEDVVTGEEIGRSDSSAETGRSCAVVRFTPRQRHQYGVRIRHLAGQAAPFHLVALGGMLQYATARGSIPFPGDGPEVIAVGAVTGDGQRASYSSCGPNSGLPKPDLVAMVPFPSLWRTRPFAGTSAAAPQAAAVAALWWCQHPGAPANDVARCVAPAARDLGPPGHDYETGYGLVPLP